MAAPWPGALSGAAASLLRPRAGRVAGKQLSSHVTGSTYVTCASPDRLHGLGDGLC